MGFLHAYPKGDKQTAAKNRMQSYKVPPLPEIKAGQYILEAFLSINTGELIPWVEIDAYARLTGNLLEAWEAEMVRAMSVEYLAGRKLGEDPFSYPPYE